jgi:putative FmdB family regulatory protein
MPRYEYECDHCKEVIQIFHSMDESIDSCPDCGSADIKKSFKTPIAFFARKERDRKAGELVEEFIQESKEELKNEKREVDKNR